MDHRAAQLDDNHLTADLIVALGFEHVGALQRRGVDDDRIRYVGVKNPCGGTDFDDAFDIIARIMPALHAWVDKRLVSARFESATGWRFWIARPDALLRSPCAPGITWPRQSAEAVCRSHTPPAPGCSCGWYADLTRDLIVRRARAFQRCWRAGLVPARPFDPAAFLVIGKVDLVDVAVAAPQPWRSTGPKPRLEYRARAGTIRELAVLDAEPGPAAGGLADELAARYRVPITFEAAQTSRRGDGNGWVSADNGVRYWGRYGAAGLLLWAPRPDGTPAVLLQHRAGWSHHGGTWGLPGGARDSHETAEEAAVREACEEAGLSADQFRVRATVVTATAPGASWTYTTVVADADHLLPAQADAESLELRWVSEHDVAGLPLHPGFAASWLALRTLLPAAI